MVTFSSYNALGSSIETGELTDGSVTHNKLGTDVNAWKLIETLTFSGDTTKTSSESLAGFTEFKITGNFKCDSATLQNLYMRLNNNSTGVYFGKKLDNTSVTTYWAQTSNFLTQFIDAVPSNFMVLMPSITKDFIIIGGGYAQSGIMGIQGGWTANVQLTSITVYCQDASTGSVKIYGR